MKKPVLVIISLLAVIFILITVLKENSNQMDVAKNQTAITSDQKENIRQFWKVFRRATDHRIAGRINEALQDYTNSSKLNDNHEDSWYYLGAVHRSLGHLKEAENAWKRLTLINPNSARAFLQMGNLYLDFPESELFNLQLAESSFKIALEINQEETGSILRLGQVALLGGDLKSAQKYFSDVIASNFKSVDGYILNGYIAWKIKSHSLALNHFKNAINYSKITKPTSGVLGEGDTKTGKVLGRSSLKNDQSLFDIFMKDLSNIKGQNQVQAMAEKYKQLDSFLENLRGNI